MFYIFIFDNKSNEKTKTHESILLTCVVCVAKSWNILFLCRPPKLSEND